eukprot:SAG31_NODE_3426_length_4289_cov_14.374702_4_plen_210_part_00
MYFIYCIIMAFNKKIAAALDAAAAKAKSAVPGVKSSNNASGNVAEMEFSNPASQDFEDPDEGENPKGGDKIGGTDWKNRKNRNVTGADAIKHTSQFRTGLWSMMMDTASLSEQAELHLVSHVTVSSFDCQLQRVSNPPADGDALLTLSFAKGDVDQTFADVDKDNSGFLEQDEIKQVLQHLRLKAGGTEESITVSTITIHRVSDFSVQF